MFHLPTLQAQNTSECCSSLLFNWNRLATFFTACTSQYTSFQPVASHTNTFLHFFFFLFLFFYKIHLLDLHSKMDWSVKKAAPVRTYRGVSRVCMPQTHIYFLSEKAESESVAAAECKRARSLSDQPTVPSDISVTPQRIMTVGAAVPCVVLKRFISSCALSSASAQVLNNAFLFFYFFYQNHRSVSQEAGTRVQHGSRSRVSRCVFHDASGRLHRQAAPAVCFTRRSVKTSGFIGSPFNNQQTALENPLRNTRF